MGAGVQFPEIWHVCTRIRLVPDQGDEKFPHLRWVSFQRTSFGKNGKKSEEHEVLMSVDEIFFEVGHAVKLGATAVKP